MKRSESLENLNTPPESQWPLRKGLKVWCVATGMSTHYPFVFDGKIGFYNAAKVGSCVVSQGNPFYKVITEDGGYELVHADLIYPHAKSGHASALRAMAKMYRKSAESLQCTVNELIRIAEMHESEAEKLAERKRPLEGKE